MNKKRIVITVIVIVALSLTGTLFHLSHRPPQNPDDLWPENGEVIAIIDGKEYRYDPIYLYRLTGACFSEDYREGVDRIYGHGYGTYSEVGIYFGESQGEIAVCLELLYLEGKEKFGEEGIGAMRTESYCDDTRADFQYMRSSFFSDSHKEEILARHEAAKFYPSQSDNKFASEIAPYIEKFAYMDQAGYDNDINGVPWGVVMSGFEQDEFNRLRVEYYEEHKKNPNAENVINKRIAQNLMAKYNVEMVEGK